MRRHRDQELSDASAAQIAAPLGALPGGVDTDSRLVGVPGGDGGRPSGGRMRLRRWERRASVYAFVCLTPWYLAEGAARQPGGVSGAGGHLAGRGGDEWRGASGDRVAGRVGFAKGPDAGAAAALRRSAILLYLLSVGLHYAALAVEASHARGAAGGGSANAGARGAVAGAEIPDQPAFPVQQPAFHRRPGHRSTAAGAREMCVRLSEFLRSSLALGDRESIPLREELALARSYLEVERVRFGERLRVEEASRPGARSAPCRRCCCSRWWKTP